jgi:phage shock protein A
MSLWKRVRLLLTVKASGALDEMEDPRQTIEYAYWQQVELLRKVRQGLVEVATGKVGLDRQCSRLRSRVPQLEDQAKRALEAGREDLARLALERKQAALAELEGLDQQVKDVAEDERKLVLAERRMANAVEEFRTRRQVVSARYTAATAQVRANEALTGVSEELAELWQALERAEDKTARMQVRASAIDALVESGVLALPGVIGDQVERELRQLALRRAVDDELARLKGAQPNSPPTSQDAASEDETK